jgi:hypothetical protein
MSRRKVAFLCVQKGIVVNIGTDLGLRFSTFRDFDFSFQTGAPQLVVKDATLRKDFDGP